ncbi:MAG: tRNA glutamyl-Q(34) synthetase GluQRS [Proteobacteria bacterium]|nr:tRNA glutamyl-Q(34) synthetase GluQRS [Pseudomonadota bacterium]
MTGWVTRFAPSPTGELHLGHVYAAWVAWSSARTSGGQFLLRLEDIDAQRCRPAYADAIKADLAWLGLQWDGAVCSQSARFAIYREALARLDAKGLIYPCFCTRADIRWETEAAAHAPHGPDGPLYPGTCRPLSATASAASIAAVPSYAIRLDVAKAFAQTERPLRWCDLERGEQLAEPTLFGDVILARKDTPVSYHLAVTVDDAVQGVTLVTRGEDLFAATHIQRLLQSVLGLSTPSYRHHRLVLGPDGQRLAKRDRASSVSALREAGHCPAEVLAMAGCETLPAG